MDYIDITKLLSEDDYYKTDTHWKMENITHIAEIMAQKDILKLNCLVELLDMV